MRWVVEQPLTWLVATLLAYRVGVWLLDRTRLSVAQPVLVAVVLLGSALLLLDVDVETYAEGTAVLTFLLGPATVALAVPLHRQLHRLRGFALPMLVALVLGVLVSVGSAVLLVQLLGGSEELARTMAPKATTTPVSLALSAEIGGIPALSAVLTITAGILGAVAGPWVLDRLRVREPRARGVAIGGVSHGIGTARALAEDPVEGAFSGLSMGLTALLTSLLIPLVVVLLL
ncbi:MAG: LrgB family protein [Actinobacteria bacterium]|nr:LrgB family protein [Actinomycetota bacterium]MBU2110610.1 LrgB family protein [Actinomycetota bacterium]